MVLLGVLNAFERTGVEQESAGNQTLLTHDPKMSRSFMGELQDASPSRDSPKSLCRIYGEPWLRTKSRCCRGGDGPDAVGSLCLSKERSEVNQEAELRLRQLACTSVYVRCTPYSFHIAYTFRQQIYVTILQPIWTGV